MDEIWANTVDFHTYLKFDINSENSDAAISFYGRYVFFFFLNFSTLALELAEYINLYYLHLGTQTNITLYQVGTKSGIVVHRWEDSNVLTQISFKET